MIISSGKCFIFIHIPKTAGSSIFRALMQYNDASDTDENRHIVLMTICKRYAHLGIHSGCTSDEDRNKSNNDLGPLGKFFKFAFVRNPWDRLVSMYFYRLQHREIPEHLPFCEFVMKRNDYPFGIYREQVEFMENRKGELAVDFIGRFENLKKDWDRLQSRIGIKKKLGHLKRTCHIHYQSYYNQELIDEVARIYPKDITELGYHF
ncbi:MAG: sulfotransferase family 2 domain-containing protein [Candidatus Aminicenantes bacterium]|nr:sulfotransferase family 2 domain-containing protein [Candidatus Aminicenantes bacterium]